MTKSRKLDIFNLLRAVEQRDHDWLSRQPEDVQKEFSPLLAMRWAAGSEGGTNALCMLWLINQRVNHRLYEQDADLSFRLLASCGMRRRFKYNWLAPIQRTTNNAALHLLSDLHPSASDHELQMLLSLYTREQFVELVQDCGKSTSEAKACLDAFTKLRG